MNLLSETLSLCEAYNIKPDKSKGQNFLINEDVYDQIINSAELTSKDTVLEVGPGLGFLTFKMAKKVKKVLAVEVDSAIAETLETLRLGQGIDNVKIYHNDILKARGNNFSKLGDYKVVSNLPYNITSVFLRKMLTLKNKPQTIVLLLQKEVVNRIISAPPKMTILSISVQFYAQAELLFNVTRDNFYPSPKVDSAVIKIVPHSKSYLNNYEEEKRFFKILRIGFSSKRKMLKNNLSIGLNIDAKIIESILVGMGLNIRTRAEELSIDDWLKILALL